LPESWTLKKLLGKHASEPLNPLIADAFFHAGYIEAWERGIEKINRECREHGIGPPVYEIEPTGMMVTFRANPAHIQAAGKFFLGTATPEESGQARAGETATRPESQPESRPD
jgi:ATP-dependent DNA helicase RecG